MNKQAAAVTMWANARAIVTRELGNEIRAVWELRPIVGVEPCIYRGSVLDPKARLLSMSSVALAVAAKLGCPKFENPMIGDGSAAEWNVYGCCVQIVLKEGLIFPGKIYPGLADALRRVGTQVPEDIVILESCLKALEDGEAPSDQTNGV